MSTPASAPFSVDAADPRVEALTRLLADTAVARDREGGHAATERQAIRESGLLKLAIPQALGGEGASWSRTLDAVRRLATVDSALAHVFAFHHLQVATVLRYGNAEQQSRLLGDTASRGWFWGNALNPLDKRCAAQAVPGGFSFHGDKSFCSGALGSDMLIVSAWHAESQSLVIAAVPSAREGVELRADWDAFGQRQTDSGSVRFEHVFVPDADVLQTPGAAPSVATTARALLAQLILVNLYLGIAQGALAEALRYLREEARPWSASGVTRAADDPYAQQRAGELHLLVRPAELLADFAAATVDTAFAQGPALTTQARGEAAIRVAEAKALAHKAALEVGNRMFDLMGARASSGRFGYDRFWRNARVHTLHDPLDYKIRDIGRHVIDGTLPEPGPYS
ncbi:acyl-CoA dehydrogenase family protein [Niveibacterium sp. SC-1]|uniref:acyl-CoA dehydrogenase family protein n=1 Tax=Niveibacterium sp. SC-1 TaxID=3135646 RepID=UPI00311D747C